MESEPRKYMRLLSSKWSMERWMRNGNSKVQPELISYISIFVCNWFMAVCSLCLLGSTMWIFYQESSDPSLMNNLPWLDYIPVRSSVGADIQNISNVDEPLIKASYIRGKEAVQQFRDHLKCFSESGKWVYDPTPRHLPWNYIGEAYGSKCDKGHQRSGPGHVAYDRAEAIARDGNISTWLVREELKWVWQTNSSCPFRAVNRDDLCRRIGPRRNVMFVGDSLNHQTSYSLMNNLVLNGNGYGPLSLGNQTTDGVYEMCGDIFGAGNGFKVSFVRNDRLTPVVSPKVNRTGNYYEFPWLNLVDEWDVKVLVMNRGAHYEEDAAYAQALRNIFTILSDRFPHVRVIYRNTPPGHVHCETYKGPLTERQNASNLPWHWGEFHRQNQLAAKIVEEFQYIYMDVDTMISLRADGHIGKRDCLHYCVPGPLDLSIQYLYNVLLLL
ncbi:hypothetical protein R1sor_014835 [Riccia sorocarpa]|uniref:Trichome birefringence-like C-terminal domain-containing protein n=1 Tax=Riccia sorocarpa TaxID=122646 RepID=A0ABD3HER5_9MARC